jgi:Fe-S-cluster containining protein
MDIRALPVSQPTPTAPKLHACVNCPVNFMCCSVSARGGLVEPPYLVPSEVSVIEAMTGTGKDIFVEERMNPITGNTVSFVSPAEGHGCRFHDAGSGKCNIYDARPIDCRLYPLDVLFQDGKYYWILWQYCEITAEDLQSLLKYGESILPSIGEHLHDFATIPLETMDNNPFQVVKEIQFEGTNKKR